MGFSQQEYWNGVPFPPPGDLPDPGIEPISFNVSCIGKWIVLPVAPPGKLVLKGTLYKNFFLKGKVRYYFFKLTCVCHSGQHF